VIPNKELEKIKSQLYIKGAVVIPEISLPFSNDEKRVLDQFTEHESLDYQIINKGDTDEDTSLNIARVKTRNNNNIGNLKLYNILNSKNFSRFLYNVTGEKNFHLDRIQSHIFYTHDFIGKHVDSLSVPSYIYSGVIHFNSEYEGGEFVAYLDSATTIKPDGFSLILFNSHIPHEVKKITKGRRKTLVFFLEKK
jgi:hypothetical protein